MRWILGLFGILVFAGGLVQLLMATTILQQIFAAIILCWSGTLFVGSAIVEGLRSNEKVLNKIACKIKNDGKSQSAKEAEKIEWKM